MIPVVLWAASGCATVYAVEVQTVVVSGQSVPGGSGLFGNPTIATSFQGADDSNLLPLLSDSGHVLFRAYLSNTNSQFDNSGLFSFDPNSNSIEVVFREGDPVRNAEGGLSTGQSLGFFGEVFNDDADVRISPLGQPYFTSSIEGTNPFIDNDTGIYTYSGGSVLKVAREGDLFPGGGGVVPKLSRSVGSLKRSSNNASGDFAFRFVQSGSPALYRYDTAFRSLEKVLGTNESPLFVNDIGTTPVLTSGGQVRSWARFPGNRSGVLGQFEGTPPVRLFGEGVTLRSDGNPVASLSDLVLTPRGAVFRDASSPAEVFLYRNNGVQNVVKKGQPAEGSSYRLIGNLFGTYDINDEGDVLFSDELTDQREILSSFSIQSGVRTVAVDGDRAPESAAYPGESGFLNVHGFLSPSSILPRPKQDNYGHVAFQANVLGDFGVDDYQALFWWDPSTSSEGTLSEVFRLGQPLPGGSTINVLKSFDVNNRGQLVAEVSTHSNERVLLLLENQNLTEIVRTSDTIQGLNISGFTAWGLNNTGHLVLNSDVNVGDAVFLFTLNSGQAGDFTADNTVDGADFMSWQRSFSSTTTLAADGNFDGVVDAIDLTLWSDTFGAAASSTGSSIAVPEPSSAVLLLSVVFCRYIFSKRLA